MKRTLDVSNLHCRSPPVKRQIHNRKVQAVLGFTFSQRARTAFLAPSERCCADRFLALAFPPFFPSATAC